MELTLSLSPNTCEMIDINQFADVPCAICGNCKPITVSKRGQFGLPANVAICQHDGLVWLTPRWTRDRYQKFYTEEYDLLYRTSRHSSTDDDARAREIVTRLQLADITTATSLLDIGAGEGTELMYVANQLSSTSLAAIESSDRAVEYLKTNHNIQVLARDVDEPWQDDHEGYFSIVIMRHVLEHMLDPVKTLKKATKVLTDSGAIYVAVPNMMNPHGSLRNYWFRAVHTYYFSSQTLLRVASAAGLIPVTIGTNEHELFCVLRRGDNHAEPSENAFHEQLRVIRKHARGQMLPDLYRSIKTQVRRLVRHG